MKRHKRPGRIRRALRRWNQRLGDRLTDWQRWRRFRRQQRNHERALDSVNADTMLVDQLRQRYGSE